MGSYDTVYVACPKCKRDIEFQSKSGKCNFSEYESLDHAPANVLVGLINDYEHCYCGHTVTLREYIPPQTIVRIE